MFFKTRLRGTEKLTSSQNKNSKPSSLGSLIQNEASRMSYLASNIKNETNKVNKNPASMICYLGFAIQN